MRKIKKEFGQVYSDDLSLSILEAMTPRYHLSADDIKSRPKESIIELMNWAENIFSPMAFGKKTDPTNRYTHDRIIIDGQFLSFCKENKITVECLLKDSISSINNQINNCEKFFIQGAFLIKFKNLTFLHFALWNKGMYNDDEISFFNIVPNKSYEDYISITDQFYNWTRNKDRSNLYIMVSGGEEIPYTKDFSWDELFLPKDLKLELKDLVENFLSSKEFYNKSKIPWKRGVLLFGEPGCHAKGTSVIMSNGSIKNVEDVEVGEFLLGPDGNVREVFRLVRGNECSYKITPNKGDSFIVNENHILHLCYSSNSKKNLPKYLNISVKELLTLSKPLQSRLKLNKSSAILFNNTESLPIDPYMLGLWLGDGTTSEPELTTVDFEIIEYCKKYAERENLRFVMAPTKSKAFTIRLSRYNGSDQKNIFSSKLNELGILNKKSIPQQYLTASINDRLQLLAGLIDADGSHNIHSIAAFIKYGKLDNKKGCFDFIQKDFDIVKQMAFLTRSLGLGFTTKLCRKSIKKTGFVGTYYRCSIYGDIYKIPTILPRKQAGQGNPNKNPLNIGIKSIECVGNNDYYGFTIDKDHLYLTDDFFIHHNCGKSSIIKTIISEYDFKPVTFVPGANSEILREAFAYAEGHSPSLLYIEDLDSLIESGLDTSTFLNLLDGIAVKNGLLVIATANNVKKLQTNITRRPSRFDRKFEITLPSLEMAHIYINRWFGNIVSDKKCMELAKLSVQYGLSYAYLKDLYISSMFEALAHNRKVPTSKDIDNTLTRLVKDRNILNDTNYVNEINTDKYFK